MTEAQWLVGNDPAALAESSLAGELSNRRVGLFMVAVCRPVAGLDTTGVTKSPPRRGGAGRRRAYDGTPRPRRVSAEGP